MPSLCNLQKTPVTCLLATELIFFAFAFSQDRRQPDVSILRWTEGQPGCTFSADDDGKYRYGVWTDDFGVVIAVDADEVRKASLRIEPLFGVFVTLRYRGQDSLSVNPADIRMEFVKHYHDVEKAIDPDDFAAKLQTDADAFAEETQRQISKHPEKKIEKESLLRIHEKNISETQEFLKSRSLRPARLDSAHPEVTGWVFFSARSKWIGDWKKQEQFVLRIPIADRVIEFPFALPPSQGDLILRRR
jgi:hypothetical protein